jgi:recombination protein RecA
VFSYGPGVVALRSSTPLRLHTLEPAAPLDPAHDTLVTRLRPGRIVECSGSPEGGGSARTSTAVGLLRHVQAQGDTAAWIQRAAGPLFPPDLHEAGIDLDALVVVHIATSPARAGMCKAAELLLRSGAFGLVVIDLEGDAVGTPAISAWLGRVQGLARQHDSHVVLLTEKPSHADSLGTLVGLRIEPRRRRDPRGAFVVDHHVIKNKSGAPFDVVPDPYRHPDGVGP